MEVEYLGRPIGTVEVPDQVGKTVTLPLRDGSMVILNVSKPFRSHTRRILARLTKLETIRAIASFVEYRP